MTNHDLDNLLDSALSKDGKNIPKLSATPDASLVAKLSEKNSDAHADESPRKSSQIRIFSKGLSKIAVGVVSIGTVIFIFYTAFSSSTTTLTPQQNPSKSNIAIDSAKKYDTIIGGMKRQKNSILSTSESNRKGVMDSTGLLKQGMISRHSEDLLPPASSRTINKDSITLPIRNKD